MTNLGEAPPEHQEAVRYVAMAALRAAARGEARLDVANVPRAVLAGVGERLDYAGAAWRREGRFLVVGGR